MDQSSGDWQLMEGHIPSGRNGRGVLSSVVYSMNRLSNALGLTALDEDDSEYKQRVMRSEGNNI